MKILIMKGNKWLILLSLLIIWGCAGNAPTPTRDILLGNQVAPEGFGAYGYLIFTKRPSPSDIQRERHSAVCEMFLIHLESVESYPDVEKSQLMPTYWLLNDSTNISNNSTDCSKWINAYNYARAKTIASLISNSVGKDKVGVEGPLLVAWSQPYEKVNDQDEFLLIDLSSFSNEDIDRAFEIWLNHITKDPEVWQDGFKSALKKEEVRNFFEKYGDQVIVSVKTVTTFFRI